MKYHKIWVKISRGKKKVVQCLFLFYFQIFSYDLSFYRRDVTLTKVEADSDEIEIEEEFHKPIISAVDGEDTLVAFVEGINRIP